MPQILNGLLFISCNLSAAYISFSLAGIGMYNRERRILASLAGFPVIVFVVLIIVGTVGKLYAWTPLILLLPLAATLAFVRCKYFKHTYKMSPWKKKVPNIFIVSIVFGGLLFVFLNRNSLTGIKFTWDDLAYHASAPAHWLLAKKISYAPLNYHAYYPFNAEIISLWFMLPFHSDALVSLGGLYWGIILVTATLSLSSKDCLYTSILCASALLLSPDILDSAITFSAADLAGSSMALAAIALLPPKDAGRIDVLYCGLLSGFAAGCKISFAPVGVILFLYIAFKRDKCIFFLLGFAVTGIYWYARNAIITHNPLFPAEIWHFKGPFAKEYQYRTELISWILADPTNIAQWKNIIKWSLNWPLGLGLLSFTGYAVSLKKLKSTHTQRLLFIIGITLILLYPLTPFSGTVNTPNAGLGLYRRYLILPFVIGLILFIPLIKRQGVWRPFFVICTGTSFYSYLSTYQDAIAFTFGAFIAFVLMRGFKNNTGLQSKERWVCCNFKITLFSRVKRYALLFFILFILAIWEPYSKKLNDAKIFNYSMNGYSLGSVWHSLEALPDGAKVSGFGSGAWGYYPLFGRRLQFTPSFPFRTPLHLSGKSPWRVWKKHKKNRFPRKKKKIRTNALISKIISEKIDYLLVTHHKLKWNSSKWPPQYKLLNSAGQVEKVFDNGKSVIWKVGDAITN